MNKSNFQTVIFAIIFATINGHRSKLFKSIFYGVQTEGKGEINKALLLKKWHFHTIPIEGLKSKLFY